MAESGDGFQRLCHEAVLACGFDINAVERYIVARMSNMDASEHAQIKRDIARIFAFQAPATQAAYMH